MKFLLPLLLVFSTLELNAQEDTAKLPDQVLDTVIIKRAEIMVEADRTIVTFPENSAARGTDVLEMLRQTPGIIIDPFENILLATKGGALILIDGRNTGLSGQELSNFLRSLPAAEVSSIELISQPPAKYEASGAGGVINIRLKKNLHNGWNGNFSSNYQQSLHSRGGASAGFNLRKRGLNIFASGNLQRGEQHVKALNNRAFENRSYDQDGVEVNTFHHENLRVGLDIYLKNNQNLGLLYIKSVNNSRLENFIDTRISSSSVDSSIHTTSILPFFKNRDNLNLNYSLKWKKSSLEVNADHIKYGSSVENELTNNYYDNNQILVSSQQIKNIQGIQLDLNSIRIDYKRELKEKIFFEGGLRIASSTSKNNFFLSNYQGSFWKLDSNSTNYFDYSEWISAGYASFSAEWGAWSWKGGIRAEQTKISSQSRNGKEIALNSPNRQYLNLFPSIFLQYRYTSSNSLGFSFVRRIDRPLYQDQNPANYSLDALNREEGNAFLNPQFINSVELSFTHNYSMNLKLGFSQTQNYIERVTYRKFNGTTLIPENVGRRRMYSVAFSTPFSFSKKWNGFINLVPYVHDHLTRLRNNNIDTTIFNSSIGFNGYLSNNLHLGKGWKGELSGWFSFQNQTTIYTALPIGSINLSLSKSILKDAGTVKLSFYDLLNSQRWKQDVANSEIQMTTYRKWESQALNLSVSYRFGKMNLNQRERKTANADEDRIK